MSLKFPVSPTGKVGVCIAAFLVSVAAAHLFYRLVEQPARSWAARIHYGECAGGAADRQALARPLDLTLETTGEAPPAVRD